MPQGFKNYGKPTYRWKKFPMEESAVPLLLGCVKEHMEIFNPGMRKLSWRALLSIKSSLGIFQWNSSLFVIYSCSCFPFCSGKWSHGRGFALQQISKLENCGQVLGRNGSVFSPPSPPASERSKVHSTPFSRLIKYLINFSWGKKKKSWWLLSRRQKMCSYFSADWRSWGSERGWAARLQQENKTQINIPSCFCPTWHSRNWAGKVLDWWIYRI